MVPASCSVVFPYDLPFTFIKDLLPNKLVGMGKAIKDKFMRLALLIIIRVKNSVLVLASVNTNQQTISSLQYVGKAIEKSSCFLAIEIAD